MFKLAQEKLKYAVPGSIWGGGEGSWGKEDLLRGLPQNSSPEQNGYAQNPRNSNVTTKSKPKTDRGGRRVSLRAGGGEVGTRFSNCRKAVESPSNGPGPSNRR